jgi:hypothetical protein
LNRVLKYSLVGVAAWATMVLHAPDSTIVAVLPLADGSELVLSSAHAELCRDGHAAFIVDGTAFGDKGCWERSYGNVIVKWSESGTRNFSDVLGEAHVYSQQESWIYKERSALLTGFDSTRVEDWNWYEIAGFLGPFSLICWGAWFAWLILKRKEDDE